MTPRREMTATLVALGAAGAVLLLASGRTWARTVPGAGRLEVTRRLTGSGLQPGIPALALVALAAVVAVLATRGLLRRAVGVLTVAAGGLAAGLAGTSLPSGAAGTGWRQVALAAAVLTAAAGAVVVVRATRWPAMSARYDAPAPADAPADATERTMWDALERGEDPTA